MERRFRLAAVLRARLVQEQVARGAVVRARADARAAADRCAAREQALTDHPTVDGGPAAWYMAALAARQALAGEMFAAGRLAEQAAERVVERAADLTGAAIRRRSVEALADRHAAAVQHAELAAGQRVVDEIAATRRTTEGIEP
jgi:hypothetical protein